MIQLHDTHAHIDLLIGRELDIDLRSTPHDRLDETLIEKLKPGLHMVHSYLNMHEWIIQPTVSLGNFLLCYHLLSTNEKIYLLLGAHPELVDDLFDVDNYIRHVESCIPTLISSGIIRHKLVGIGECGLDYYYTQNPHIIDKQKQLFAFHIDLAHQLKLPLVIHTRDAWNDTLDILSRHPHIHGKFEVHCFTGTIEHSRRIQDMGGMIAIGGIVTFKSAQDIQDVVRIVPPSMLLLETDLPFLAPVPHRGAICIPEYIQFTAEHIARLRNTDVNSIIDVSKQNASLLFHI